jgi:hypothetical protein
MEQQGNQSNLIEETKIRSQRVYVSKSMTTNQVMEK